MVTWRDLANIIKRMCECKDCDIAEQLGVSPSIFSKVVNNHTKPSDKFLASAVYRKIFVIAKGSMVFHDPKYAQDCKNNPKDNEKKLKETCLYDLKQIIEVECPNVRDDMGDRWNTEDYHAFVLDLLKLVELSTPRNCSPEASSDGDKTATDTPLASGASPSRQQVGTSDLHQDTAATSTSTAITKGGAEPYIENKFKCCRFCAKWRGSVEDEVAICKTFKCQRDAGDGTGCKYYEPDWGQLAIELLRSP